MGILIKKKLNRLGWFSRIGLALLLALGSTALINNGALNPGQAFAAGVATIADCSGCHGYTAAFTDGTARNNPAGKFQGSHNKHVISVPTACSVCHTVPAGTTTADNNHSDGTVNIAGTISGGTYGKASFAVSNTFTPNSCSSTSCHANIYGATPVSSPNWGASSAGCTACHSVNPIVALTGPGTGGHVLSGHQVACVTCHNPGTTATSAPTTGHIGGTINIVNVGYVAGTAVAKHAAGSGYSQCSSATCHGNPYAAGTVTTPTWTNTSTGCAACHVTYPITTTGPATGGHVLPGHQVTCVTCHNLGTTATTVPSTNHGDTFINVVNVGYVAGTAVAKHAAGSGYSQCSSASCHGNPYAAGSATTPTWSGTSTGCSACHSAYPITASGPATGSHASHHNAACIECHNAGTTATTVPNTLHGNSFIDVVNNGYAANVVKHAAGTGYSTCTVNCHISTTWGLTTLDCISCHTSTVVIHNSIAINGQNRRAVANELQTSGTKNHKSATVGSAATKWDCIVCHMEGDSSTGAMTTSHANGVLDFRDPDTGTQVKKVSWSGLTYAQGITDSNGRYVETLTNFTTARFSRALGSVLESDPAWLKIASIQAGLCLKCHDSNGASSVAARNVNAAGTQYRPFGNTTVASTATQYPISATIKTGAGNMTGAVMNVFSQFSTGNASSHPLRGRQNNGFATGSMMKAPWGNSTKTGTTYRASTTVYGYLISCFDCHTGNGSTGTQTSTAVAHGNGTTAAGVALVKPYATTVGTAAAPNLCNWCHSDQYAINASAHPSGSASGFSSMNATTMGTCTNCHLTTTATVGARAVAVHGFNATEAGTATHTSGTRPYAFFRGGPTCIDWQQGTCTLTCTTETYTSTGAY